MYREKEEGCKEQKGLSKSMNLVEEDSKSGDGYMFFVSSSLNHPIDS